QYSLGHLPGPWIIEQVERVRAQHRQTRRLDADHRDTRRDDLVKSRDRLPDDATRGVELARRDPGESAAGRAFQNPHVVARVLEYGHRRLAGIGREIVGERVGPDHDVAVPPRPLRPTPARPSP